MSVPYLLIYNPKAGRKRLFVSRAKRVALPDVLTLCKKHAISVKAVVTKYPGEARELASKEGERYRGILAAGGDGTLNEVINGMAFCSKPVGLIPCGSIMHAARRFGLSHDVDEAICRLSQAKLRAVSLGEYSDTHQKGYFCTSARIGMAANCIQFFLSKEKEAARHRLTNVWRKSSVSITAKCGLGWAQLYASELSAFFFGAQDEKLHLRIYEGGRASIIRDYIRQISSQPVYADVLSVDSLRMCASTPLAVEFDGMIRESMEIFVRVSNRRIVFLL